MKRAFAIAAHPEWSGEGDAEHDLGLVAVDLVFDRWANLPHRRFNVMRRRPASTRSSTRVFAATWRFSTTKRHWPKWLALFALSSRRSS